jgi:hypothetical protein
VIDSIAEASWQGFRGWCAAWSSKPVGFSRERKVGGFNSHILPSLLLIRAISKVEKPQRDSMAYDVFLVKPTQSLIRFAAL